MYNIWELIEGNIGNFIITENSSIEFTGPVTLINRLSERELSNVESRCKAQFYVGSFGHGVIAKAGNEYHKVIVKKESSNQRTFSIISLKDNKEIITESSLFLDEIPLNEEIICNAKSGFISFQYQYGIDKFWNIGHINISSSTVAFGIVGDGLLGDLGSAYCENFEIYEPELKNWEFESNNITAINLTLNQDEDILTNMIGIKTVERDFGYIYRTISSDLLEEEDYTLSFFYNNSSNTFPVVKINDELVDPTIREHDFYAVSFEYESGDLDIQIGFDNLVAVSGDLIRFSINEPLLETGKYAHRTFLDQEDSFFQIKIKNEDLPEKEINPMAGTICMSFYLDEFETNNALFSSGEEFKASLDTINKIIFTYGSHELELITTNDNDSIALNSWYHLIYTWRTQDYVIEADGEKELKKKLILSAKIIDNSQASWTTYKSFILEEIIDFNNNIAFFDNIYGNFDNISLSRKVLGYDLITKIRNGEDIDKSNYVFYYNFRNGEPARQDTISIPSTIDPKTLCIVKTDGQLLTRKVELEQSDYTLWSTIKYKYAGECNPAINLPLYPENLSFYKVNYEGLELIKLNDSIINDENLLIYCANEWYINEFVVEVNDIVDLELRLNNSRSVPLNKYIIDKNIILITNPIDIDSDLSIRYMERDTYSLNYNENLDTIDLKLSNYIFAPNWKKNIEYKIGSLIFFNGLYYRSKCAEYIDDEITTTIKGITPTNTTYGTIFWGESEDYGISIYYNKDLEDRLLTEIELNPLLNHNNNGFLTVSQTENSVYFIEVIASPKNISLGQSSLITVDSFDQDMSVVDNYDLIFSGIGVERIKERIKEPSNNRAIFEFKPTVAGKYSFVVTDELSGIGESFEINVK